MELDLSLEVSRIFTAWKARYFDREKQRSKNSLDIFGERGCGKTAAAQAYVRAHKNKARYFSFADLEGAAALTAFAAVFELENNNPASWDEAGRMFRKKYKDQALHVLLDDLEQFPQRKDFYSASYLHIAKGRIVVSELWRCNREDWDPDDPTLASLYIGCRTLADYCKLFPEYSRSDVLRLFSMTGGILAILHELDEHAGLEENLRTLLRYDSAFSRFLPEWLGESFRTPESYYPILCAMANGKQRLSEIARDAGYPNNKCQTYLRALIHARLVRTEMLRDKKPVTYHLTNSYIAAWCLFVYRRRSLQIADPDGLLQLVQENIDRKLAMPAFYRSCFRYLEMSTKEYLIPYRYPSSTELKTDVPFRFKDGYALKLNYCVQIDSQTLIAILPDSLDKRYTKEDIQHIRAAVKRFDTLYGTDIVIFSPHRFSDWSVHEASRDELLHLVAMERLRY